MDPAVQQFYDRLNHNPDDAEALYYLWEYHGNRAEFQQLATLVEATAPRRAEPRSQADLFFRAGELWAKNVGRVDKAVGNYKRAFELDPTMVKAVHAARMIYTQLGNSRAAVALLDRELQGTAESAGRAQLLREGANLRAQLNDLDGQIAYLTELALAQPDDWELLRELAAAYLSRAGSPSAQDNDPVAAAQILAGLAHNLGFEHGLPFAEAALDAWAGDETAYSIVHNAYQQAGRTEDLAVRQIAFLNANPESRLAGDVRKNLANMYLAVQQVDDAIACLEPIANDPEISRPLADLYRQAGRVTELAQLLQALAPTTDAGTRMQDLRDLAEIYGQQGNRPAMLGAMRDLLGLDPADPEALALIEDDLRARGNYQELRDVLWGAVRAEHCPLEARVPRLREIAQCSEQRLGDAETAIATWRELLSYDPADAEALTSLEQLFTRGSRWDELAGLLEHRASVEGDEATRRDVLRRLAQVHRDRRQDGEGEAGALTQLWQLDPSNDAVSARLVELRAASGDHAGAAAVLQSRAELASGGLAVERWSQLAAQLTTLDDIEAAVEAWQRVVDLDPSQNAAWEGLERLLEQSGQYARMHETLLARANTVPAGEEHAALLARAAGAAHAMGDPSTAVREAERAVEMAPQVDAFASVLLDLLEAHGHRERLLAFVSERAALLEDGPGRMEMYRRGAHAVGATDPQGAAQVWMELRACAARAGLKDDGEALDALLGLAELQGDAARMVELLGEAAEFAEELELKREFLRRRAEVQTQELEDLEGALDTARRLTAADPEGGAGWGQRADLAERLGLHQEAADALETQVRLTDDDEAKGAAAARLVALVEAHLATPASVLHALEVQHEADPMDLGCIARLADLCENEGRFADAVRYLEELSEIEGDDEELSRLAQRVGRLAEEKLGDPRKAWAVLEPLVRNGDVACLELALGVTERHGLHAEIVPTLAELASRVSDPEARSELWREVSQRRSRHLDDRAGALEAQVQAVVAQPSNTEQLAAVDDLASGAGRPDLIAMAYQASIERCEDPTVAHDLAMRALAALEIADAHAMAFDMCLVALGRFSADDDLLDALVRLAVVVGRHDEVFLAFDKRKRTAQGDKERFAVVLRALTVAGGPLNERETAFQYLDQATSQAIGRRDPDDAMLEQVEGAARSADEARPEAGMLSGVVERFAQLAEDSAEDTPKVASVLLRHAGVLCDRDLGLVDHAVALYARAVSLWPTDLRGAEHLEELCIRARRVGEVVSLYQRVIDDAYEPVLARTYTRRRATLLDERLNRTDEAVECLKRVVELAPRDLEALHALQDLLTKRQRWQELLIALDRELEGGGDRALVSKRVAEVWERHLRNPFEARAAWQQAQRLAPDDPEIAEALARLDRRPSRDDDDLEELPAEDLAQEAPATEAPGALALTEAPEAHGEPLTPAPEDLDEGSLELDPGERTVAFDDLAQASALGFSPEGAALAPEAPEGERWTPAVPLVPSRPPPARAPLYEAPRGHDHDQDESEVHGRAQGAPGAHGELAPDDLFASDSGVVDLVQVPGEEDQPGERSGAYAPATEAPAEFSSAEDPMEALEALEELDAVEALDDHDPTQHFSQDDMPGGALERDPLESATVLSPHDDDDDVPSLDSLAEMARPPSSTSVVPPPPLPGRPSQPPLPPPWRKRE
ncbi:MAG: tetratricopeptide repeat protein [Deltaproteobacteria bacterium]|nr:tetratricopeptide repeat protein [Deltaproteobacteria bacterium]